MKEPKLFHRSVIAQAAFPALLAALTLAVGLGGERTAMALRYERDALAAGEFWRLLSGHVVHLDGVHLALNLAGLILLATLLRRYLGPIDWFGAVLLAAVVIDVGLYFGSPDVAWYVGLSGVLHGIWAAGCTLALLSRDWTVIPLTLILLAKLTFEIFAGEGSLTASVISGQVISEAHAWGALGGGIWALGVIAIRRRHASL